MWCTRRSATGAIGGCITEGKRVNHKESCACWTTLEAKEEGSARSDAKNREGRNRGITAGRIGALKRSFIGQILRRVVE